MVLFQLFLCCSFDFHSLYWLQGIGFSIVRRNPTAAYRGNLKTTTTTLRGDLEDTTTTYRGATTSGAKDTSAGRYFLSGQRKGFLLLLDLKGEGIGQLR